MITIDTPNYNFSYVDIKYGNSNISPYLEMCRHKEAVGIKRKMIDVFSKYKLTPINKRSLNENINHMFARVLFHTFSYQKRDKYDDPMFHGCDSQNGVIIEDIKSLFLYTDQLDTVIDELNIPDLFKTASLNIAAAETETDANAETKLYTITSTKKTTIYTVKSFDTSYKFHIPKNVYNKLKRRHTQYTQSNPAKYEFTYLVCCLLMRYNTMSSIGNQFGIPIAVKERFHEIGFNFECFASTLNHHYKYYCSIFYDIEKYFMSLGHFQNITYCRGAFMANPPYELSLLNSMVDTITSAIAEADPKSDILFCYGTPTWASYGTFDFHTRGRTSKYYKWHHTFDNYQVPWFDFMNNKYLKITSSTRYVLANHNIDISQYKKIIKYWIDYKNN
jgi:hypothetical protein